MRTDLHYPLYLFTVFAILAGAGGGCGQRSAPSLPLVVARASLPPDPQFWGSRNLPRASTRTEAVATAAASVQSRWEYHEAERACRRGQYRQAAEILAKLERSPGLSEDQRRFCRSQERICTDHFTPPAAPAKIVHRKSPIKDVPDCGPRALLLVCQKLGVPASLPALTKAAGMPPDGTNLAGLKRAAVALHLKAEAVQTSREALPDMPMPAIAWDRGYGGHYVAVLSLQGRGESATALVHDPNEPAEHRISQESLLQSCGGYLLLLRR